MLGKVWKKVLVFILIVACLFNIIRKVVRKTSLREELQATLDYFYARNQKVQENVVENNTTIQPNNQGTGNHDYNQIMQQQPVVDNLENQQQIINNNQQIYNNNQQQYVPSTNPNEQQYVQSNSGQGTQSVMPITQSEIEQNTQLNNGQRVNQ